MRKHEELFHKDDCKSCDYEWKVIGKFRNPLRRQLCEAVAISNTRKEELLNNKCEYFANNIGKVEIHNQKSVCGKCGRIFDCDEDLTEHSKAVHERLQCNQCPYKSFGNRDLKQHITVKHA